MSLDNKGGPSFIVNEKVISFNELYERYWERLCILALRFTMDRSSSEDIVQEVFTDLLRRFDQKEINNIEAYLYQSIRFQCLNWLKYKKVSREHLTRMDWAKRSNLTENEVNLRFINYDLKKIVSGMPPRARQVFEMSRFEHLSNNEIASRLNIKLSTVENHLTCALRIVRLFMRMVLFILIPNSEIF